ncbi:MAG: hypothetical protein SAK29_13300 [Scytonema sp. PMC 1069.18]|nr:hypothetical protein [Scytonema sp. PMC 1069.18]MEC4880371.1 hypothetical protein [Scytonema sp. PMC 1070.18]
MILLLCTPATDKQIEQMLEEHKFYIKTAVDIERSMEILDPNIRERVAHIIIEFLGNL